MKYSKLMIATLATVSALALPACTTVQYGDATAVETMNTDFGSTDLQMIAEKMVDSMLAFPPVQKMTAEGKRPVLFIDSIKNKTMEHVDTESITDTISTKLLRSGQFRFVDMSKVESVRQQMDFQHNSGMVDENSSVKMGRQIGAQYMLYGNFSNITKQSGSSRDVYYKFTMKLMDLQSGLIEWQDEKEIRKTQKKSLFGK